MIFTRMGTRVVRMIYRDVDERGNTWITCELHGMTGDREIHFADLRFDGPMHDFVAQVAALTSKPACLSPAVS